MKKKILIVGGDEILGESLIRYFATSDHELVAVTPDITIEGITELKFGDIFDRDKLKTICYKLSPDIIINTAEFSGIEECEADHKRASDFNMILTQNLVRIANIIDAKYIGFSSDLIFDGIAGPYLENSKPNPLNYYGKTKHTAENTIRTESIPWVIIRTSAPFGLSKYGKKDFVYKIIEKLHNSQNIELSDHVIRTPIYADDLALATAKMIEGDFTGIYNISGTTPWSEYQFGLFIAEEFGYSPELIILKERPEIYIPPKCGLVSKKAISELGLELSSAKSALEPLKFLYEQYGIFKKIEDLRL